jgi:hypothetical protein
VSPEAKNEEAMLDALKQPPPVRPDHRGNPEFSLAWDEKQPADELYFQVRNNRIMATVCRVMVMRVFYYDGSRLYSRGPYQTGLVFEGRVPEKPSPAPRVRLVRAIPGGFRVLRTIGSTIVEGNEGRWVVALDIQAGNYVTHSVLCFRWSSKQGLVVEKPCPPEALKLEAEGVPPV